MKFGLNLMSHHVGHQKDFLIQVQKLRYYKKHGGITYKCTNTSDPEKKKCFRTDELTDSVPQIQRPRKSSRKTTHFERRTESFIVHIGTVEINVSEEKSFGIVGVLNPRRDVVGVVADVSALRRNRHSLLVVCPRLPVLLKGRFGIRLIAHVEQERADHQPGAPFAGFAVDRHNIAIILGSRKLKGLSKCR